MSRRLFVPTALALSAAALLSACASDGYYPGGGYYPDNGGYSDGRYYPPNDGRYYPNDGRYNPNDGRYYPDGRYPDGRYPDNRRRPDGRYPDGRYPGGRTPEQATEDYNRAASASYKISLTSVLLPDPDTPVTTVSTPSGNATSIFFKLFAFAPRTVSQLPFGLRRSFGTGMNFAPLK